MAHPDEQTLLAKLYPEVQEKLSHALELFDRGAAVGKCNGAMNEALSAAARVYGADHQVAGLSRPGTR